MMEPAFTSIEKFHGKFYGRNTGETVVPCGCPKLPSSLLYTSHAISEEVVHILYSENQFTISAHGDRGLKPLRRLGSRALAALRSLSVRLNSSSCVYGHISFPGRDILPCHRPCEDYGLHDRPIGSQARQDKALLRSWYDLAQTLSTNITPGMLKLSLVCDVQDLHTAYQTTVPLEQLPLLETSSIRLGENPNAQLYELARSRALWLMEQKTSTSSQSYRYHLPDEILEQVLSYTDLVAPYDLEWLPSLGLGPFDCCKTCVATLDSCSCAFYHAAYSPTCTCWRLPISLFLTSRGVRRIATALFYSKNKFVLFPDKVNRRQYYRKIVESQSPLVQFLERFPPAGLSHLHHVTLMFPNFDPEAFLQDKRKVVEWRRAVDLLQKLDLSRLTLTLYIKEASNAFHAVPRSAQLQESYRRALQPLAQIAKVRKFFIFMGENTEPLSYSLEKSVMGPDYNATANGKLEAKITLWYDGFSLDGPVLGPDGGYIWPPSSCTAETASQSFF